MNPVEAIEIVDVTDAYYPGDSQPGEVLMEDLSHQMDTVVTFPSEVEAARRVELSHLQKDVLIEIIIEREQELRKRTRLIHRLRQNTKLGRQSSTSSPEPEPDNQPTISTDNGLQRKAKKMKTGHNRELDFSAYGKRHVALRFLYLGWNYHGFVVQDETDNTVEDHIFTALSKTKLIQSRETSNYHRCGRTDKSVSAFSQVISLHVRSTCTEGPGLIEAASSWKSESKEIPYVQILNGVLPKNIRLLSWSPVAPDFSARFSCGGRRYRYYFPRANLDIHRMNEAATRLLGQHDFRNFCKADINGGVTNYVRRIEEIFVEELAGPASINQSSTCPQYDMCVLHVYGSAFLWHQVRSIVALLFLVGQGKEDSAMISELLDIEKNPAKPQYTMAEGFPLVLFDCSFDQVVWQSDQFNLRQNIKEMEKSWTEYAVKAAMISDMIKHVKERLRDLSDQETDSGNLLQVLLPEGKGKAYQPLRSRKTCDTIESRLQKKLKVDLAL